MRKRTILLLLLAPGSLVTQAQTTIATDKKVKQIAAATDFNVPASPAFILLDVTPAKVNRPGFARDFKIDWIYTNGGIAPNIAIEAQPVWLFGFRNTDYTRYRDKSWLLKQASTLSVSLGTVKREDLQSLGWGVKMNLFRQKRADPLQNDAFMESIRENIRFSEEEIGLLLKLEATREAMEVAKTTAKAKLKKEVSALEAKIKALDADTEKELKWLKRQFADENWNAAMIDVGYGNAYDYLIDKEVNHKLSLHSSTSGLWINAAHNFGARRFLLSGLYKYLGRKRSVHYVGGNLRYGTSKLNVFTEYVYETKSEIRRNTIAYGGDFKVAEQLLVQFGIRTEYNADFKLKALTPMVSVNWLLKMN